MLIPFLSRSFSFLSSSNFVQAPDFQSASFAVSEPAHLSQRNFSSSSESPTLGKTTTLINDYVGHADFFLSPQIPTLLTTALAILSLLPLSIPTSHTHSRCCVAPGFSCNKNKTCSLLKTGLAFSSSFRSSFHHTPPLTFRHASQVRPQPDRHWYALPLSLFSLWFNNLNLQFSKIKIQFFSLLVAC